MKPSLLIAASLLVCSVVPAVLAKDPPKKKKEIKDVPLPDVVVDEAAIALLKPYDKNGNMEIDKDEFVALAAAFKADPTGPLKQFDLGKDGALDDVDRLGINNKLGAVAAKKQRDAEEAKRQKRVEKAKAAAAAK